MTLRLNGSTSGYTEIDAPAVAGSNTLVLPGGNGSANQLLKNGSTAGSLGWSSMVEDSSGAVSIGTTSQYGKLTISSASGSILGVDASSTNDALVRYTSSGTAKAETYWQNANNRYYVAVGGSGGVYLASGGTSWTAASDERVKNIIEPITDGASKVNKLRAVIGTYKSDASNTRKAFLIAQDVQKVLPEAVDASNPSELGLSYSDVIPLLTAALQEAFAKIDALETRLASMEVNP